MISTDVRAVMDAAGSERAALLGVSEGGAMSALFAATYPERTAALVLYGSFARAGAGLMSEDELEERLEALERDWPHSLDPAVPAPSEAGDEEYRKRWLTFMRHAASPGAAIALLRMNSQIDVREILPTIRVPTLVLYRTDARFGHGASAWREAGEDPITPERGGPLPRGADSGGPPGRASRSRSPPLGRRHRPAARRGGRVPDRSAACPGSGPRPRHDPLHRPCTILFTDIVGPPRSPRGWETSAGGISSAATTRSSGASSNDSEAASSTRRATGS